MTSDNPTAISFPTQTRHALRLAERREIARIEQLANFGLSVGWVCALVGGFCWFCVISRLDWLWLILLVTGICLLATAVTLPDLLEIPCRWWMKLAHLQGSVVMTILLTLIYFALMTPIGWLIRRRRGTHPFYSWHDERSAPKLTSGWEPLTSPSTRPAPISGSRRRSLFSLLLSTIGFFFDRGHYFVLPILILLLLLGVVLFFVQGSVLAPFIYTIF